MGARESGLASDDVVYGPLYRIVSSGRPGETMDAVENLPAPGRNRDHRAILEVLQPLRGDNGGRTQHGPSGASLQAGGGGLPRSPSGDGPRIRQQPHERRGGRPLRRRLWGADPRPDQLAQRLPIPDVGHPDRDHGARRPRAALGQLLPRLAARAPSLGRAGAHRRGGRSATSVASPLGG
jgi:hypothetical protein